MASFLRTIYVTQRTNLALLQLSATGAVLFLFAAFHSRFPADLTIAKWIQAPATAGTDGAAWLDTFMESVSSLASFPFAAASVAIVGTALLLARRWRAGLIVLVLTAAGVQNQWLRRALMFLLTSLLVLIGLSRVYLGAHWPSDVLGSVFFSAAALILLLRLYQRLGGQWPTTGKADPR